MTWTDSNPEAAGLGLSPSCFAPCLSLSTLGDLFKAAKIICITLHFLKIKRYLPPIVNSLFQFAPPATMLALQTTQ